MSMTRSTRTRFSNSLRRLNILYSLDILVYLGFINYTLVIFLANYHNLLPTCLCHSGIQFNLKQSVSPGEV